MSEQLLTGEEVATLLRAKPRFVRRLVAERRIAYVKVGRLVRFTTHAVREYVDRNRVEPMTRSQVRQQLREIG
ncbi:helix-turn-helix domain-containing protein [Catellatospora coxensis]|uniref:Helix-turn-helix domain-containing protein n=1 Tax=Catellatospora coxensis TaxID=310354 RepID=A0A8J3L3H2_9ACTN|nr:helix-turn-helix domain-containing protein [Catellatospora coxensis]GIG11392.1 hypothetical protein Cco03nite_80920 [Catellatospora coxensis]